MKQTILLGRLVRVRWAARGTLALGVAASAVANILHAEPNLVSRAISAWPPLALLVTMELISRVPVHRRTLAAARMAATIVIASIAAWISYWHMAAVAAHYGETGPGAWLLPLTVDGLVVVASVSLVELNASIRALEAPAAIVAQTQPAPVGVKPALTEILAEPVVPVAVSPVVNGHRTVPLIGPVTR